MQYEIDMAAQHASADSNDGSTDIARILRPTLERRASGLGQDIDTAVGAVEPAINIVQENLSGVGNPRAEVAHALRALR